MRGVRLQRKGGCDERKKRRSMEGRESVGKQKKVRAKEVWRERGWERTREEKERGDVMR